MAEFTPWLLSWPTCILVFLSTFALVNTQTSDKFSAMNFIGDAAAYPEKLQHIASLKYSRIVNSLNIPHVKGNPPIVVDDTQLDFNDIAVDYDEFNPEEILQSLRASAPDYNVTERCLNHTSIFLQSLIDRQQWAMSMLDAAGKIPSGVLLGNLVWRGSYRQCLNVTAVTYSNNTAKSDPVYHYRGRYCRLSVPLSLNPNSTRPPPAGGVNAIFGGTPALTIGVCLPDSCDGQDLVGLIQKAEGLIPVKLPPLPLFGDCHEVQDISTDTRAIVVIVLGCLFGAVVILGSGYDIVRYQIPSYVSSLPSNEHDAMLKGYQPITQEVPHTQNEVYTEKAVLLDQQRNQEEQQPPTSRLESLLLTFSVYSNGKKLLSTKTGESTLSSVHGIRFLSMTWVILGHTYVFGAGGGDNLGSFFLEMTARFTFQGVSNATVSVDSFFVLSGLLVGYLTLREMDKGKGKLNWGLFYLHRFWRLTPPYMLIMMIYVPLFKYWGSGPFWPIDGVEINYCKNSWWTNLLYINNLVNVKEMCMGWTWYLANDMQFFVISPLILIPLYRSFVAGSIVTLVLMFASFLTTGLLCASMDIPSGLLAGGNSLDFFQYIYIKPYCRIGPYLVGLLVGYVLYKTKCRVKLHPILVAVGWICAIVINLSVVYGLYDTQTHNVKILSKDVTNLYHTLSRTGWAVGLGWLIFACSTGYGGFVNTILSWRALIPLSRLTYCAYLVHPIVMYVYYSGIEAAIHFTDLNVIYLFLGHLVISYMAAFGVSLVFESPMMGLEKVLLKRDRRS